MTTNAAVQAWATDAGFSAPQPFAGASTRVGESKYVRYAGFYLLSFTDDTYYLGESVNLRGRMAGHQTKWGSEIAEVRFLLENLSKPQLREREQSLIYQVNTILPKSCRNVTHASTTAGVDELADVLDSREQASWIADPAAFNRTDDATLKPMSKAQETKYSTASRRFGELDLADHLTQVLRTYLENCVPAPLRTEFQGWSVSAGTYNGRRAFCVSIGMMESFVGLPNGGGFINVRKSRLLAGRTISQFKQQFPGVRVGRSRPYDDAGPDQIQLTATDAEGFTRLLSDPGVLHAAAELVLDVMRKHASAYTRFHCPQLVERVYPEYQRPASEIVDSAAIVEELVAPMTPQLSEAPTEEPPAPYLVDTPDDVPIVWFVNAGPAKTGRNTVEDFLSTGEWRMDPRERYEHHVQDMLPGERIFVRKRYNQKIAPFDTRGHLVSVMDLLLGGTIIENPGDGCSVKVDWDRRAPIRTWYLYTNQDPVWAIPYGAHSWGDRLIDFAVNGASQDLDFWRNAYYWFDRFGDRRA